MYEIVGYVKHIAVAVLQGSSVTLERDNGSALELTSQQHWTGSAKGKDIVAIAVIFVATSLQTPHSATQALSPSERRRATHDADMCW